MSDQENLEAAVNEAVQLQEQEAVDVPVEKKIDFGAVLADAKEVIETTYTKASRDETFKDALVSEGAKEKVKETWGVKYMENVIKVCVTLPRLIILNQEVLRKDIVEIEKDPNNKSIKEKIIETMANIKNIDAQLDAYKAGLPSYEEVLEYIK